MIDFLVAEFYGLTKLSYFSGWKNYGSMVYVYDRYI